MEEILDERTNRNIDIIDIKYGTLQMIKEELAEMPDEYVMLVVVKPRNYEAAVLSFMQVFVNEEKLYGTYITTNKPFRKIMEKFLRKGIMADNIFFIDCVTKEPPGQAIEGVKVFTSPDVTRISVLLDKVITRKKQGGEFIFLDSISTLLVYNDEKVVEKFVHALIERIYRWRTRGVFLTVETEANKLVIENLSLFFDKVVRLTK